MVRSKGGGNGVKQERGEGVVRSKRGERERQAERKGEHTGSWWAVPSLSFMMVGVGIATSSPFMVVHVRVASSSSSVC